jgi:catechol 2,3-dioxygenase-like lactoylglutathione lyase family enzyme
MITKLSVTGIKVLDQDAALDFYVDKLGLEVGNDIQQGPVRWLRFESPMIQASRSTSSCRRRRHRTTLPQVKYASWSARVRSDSLRSRPMTAAPTSRP